MPSPSKSTIAIIGGTGPEGRGLAARFAAAGHGVIIGSRSPERARQTAGELGGSAGMVSGMSNGDATRAADLVVLTIPYAAVSGTLPGIVQETRGKIVVSAIVPLEFPEGRLVALRPEAGSAAQEVAAHLPGARVVGAFQNVDAHVLADMGTEVDADVIVTSDDADARHAVMELVTALPGSRAVSGGRLPASRYVEEITALLVTLNRIYKTHSGIRITGIRR